MSAVSLSQKHWLEKLLPTMGYGGIGLTAGTLLISLSRILTYLRIIAAGSGPGKVFE